MPNVIQKIQELYFNGEPLKVHGLTKIDVGSVGPIQNTQQWRNKELKNFKIFFSPTSEDVPNQSGYGAFEEGTFFTGKGSKTEVLEAYLSYVSYLQSCSYVFVDEKKEELEKMEIWYHKRNIPFTGVHFRGCPI